MKNILLILTGLAWCSSATAQTPTTIKTPTNVTINASIYSELSPEDLEAIEDAAATWILHHGSNAQRVGPAARTYNCHNYAWHKKDGGNAVWINAHNDVDDDPEELSPYWSGSSPSYIATSSSNATVAFYGSCWSGGGNLCDHSAQVISPSLFKSKWGNWPLYEHAPTDSPYNSSSIQYYTIPINGNDILCSSSTYSTLNISGATYDWAGSNISISGSSYSTGATATTLETEGIIQVSISSPFSGTTVVGKKTLWLGKPDLIKKFNGDIIDISSAPVAPASANILESVTNSPFTSTTFNKIDYAGTGDIVITMYNPTSAASNLHVFSGSTNGYRQVKMFATNACGTTEDEIFLYLMSFFKAVYPNPAKEYLTIEFNNLIDKATLPDAIELYQEESMKRELSITIDDLLKDTKNLQGSKYMLDIKSLKRGIWYLHGVKKGHKTEVVRLLFE